MSSEYDAFSSSSQCHNESVRAEYIILSRSKTSYRKEDAKNIENFQTLSSWIPPKLAKDACLSSERRQEFPRAKDNQ